MSAATPSVANATSTATVTVASKLPFPLRLQLQKKVTRTEETPGGAREMVSYVKHGNKTIVIDGCAKPVGVDSDKHLVGGFALTHDVDAEFWTEWVKQNEGFPPLVNGLIFASSKNGNAISEAKEKKGVVSGFEPVDPKNPPAEFSRVTVAA